ncbi:hypothetical protein [Streptomyces sp. NPDC054786]
MALSCSGLRALGVRESSLESFPAEFREGMALKGFGRVAMLMESHVLRADSRWDVGSAREEQWVRAAVEAEGDGSGPAHRGG